MIQKAHRVWMHTHGKGKLALKSSGTRSVWQRAQEKMYSQSKVNLISFV